MRSGARRPAGGAGPGGTDDVVAHSGQDLGEEEEQEEEQAVQGSNAAKQEGEEGVPERHPAHPYTSGDKVHVRRTWGQLPAGCPQCSPDIACQGISVRWGALRVEPPGVKAVKMASHAGRGGPRLCNSTACVRVQGECQMPGAHGGAGIILSVGLMRQLDLLRLYRRVRVQPWDPCGLGVRAREAGPPRPPAACAQVHLSDVRLLGRRLPAQPVPHLRAQRHLHRPRALGALQQHAARGEPHCNTGSGGTPRRLRPQQLLPC